MQRPNMALTQKVDNINWSLIFERPKTIKEKGRGKERRRGRGREEEDKRRRKEDQKGMELYGSLRFIV